MQKKKLSNLDLDFYEEKLDNGFRIFVVPYKNSKNVYATLSTKYGSNNYEFVPINEDKMVSFPLGIAHFLEHKVFEQEKGMAPFEFFSMHGANANANTTNKKTTYLFSGSKYLKENLNYLFDYVYAPYFTEENVEKEKGIIIEEIHMYEDDPYSVIYEDMVCNTFINHPMKYKVIGDVKNVSSITKEDLYRCYNTFYQPSNMFLTITGNVNPKEIVSIVKKNLSKKKFNKPYDVKLKEYDEPNEVAKAKEIKKMNVNIPKVGIGYKINIDSIKLPYRKVYDYISLFFNLKFDETSLLKEELIKKHIINDEIYLSNVSVDNFICYYLFAETNEIDRFINLVKKEIKNLNIDKKDFERKKNAIISGLISASDNIYSINNKIMGNIIRFNEVTLDDYDMIKSLKYSEFMKVIKSLDLTNSLTYEIVPKK